jgi:hypothetical protein
MQLQTATRVLAVLAAFAIALTNPVSLRPIQNMSKFPLSFTDRRIDELGAEAQIQTETDAEAYVEAFLEKFKLDEVEPRLINMWKARLARAEFAAVRHPERRIPEDVVADAFNQLMEKWKVPAWTRVSLDELRVLRTAISIRVYPRSMPLFADDRLSRTCRPTEALFLVYLLQARGGLPTELTNVPRTGAGEWPNTVTTDQESPVPLMVRLDIRSSAEAMRLSAYFAARASYFAHEPDDSFQKEVDELFRKFQVD